MDSRSLKQPTETVTVERQPLGAAASRPKGGATLLFYCRDDVHAVSVAPGQELVVGRAFPSHVVFEDRSLSRQHARIGFVDGQLQVHDLKSTNRVWLNGEAVASATVHTGDVVRLGNLTVTVEPNPTPARAGAGFRTYRALRTQLAQELARARDYRRPLSLLLVRLAPPATAVNAWCPGVLDSLRCADGAAIYGADALAVLLAETDDRAAQAWAEQLRTQTGLALRFGIAVYPSAGAGPEALLGHARAALSSANEATPVRVAAGDGDASTSLASEAADSEPMRALHGLATRVARSRLPVLVLGETGSGKEVLAKRVHAQSAVAGGPFRVLNCAALAPTLMEDTFFGHEAGAFTGASRPAPGLFEQAHGGTLFLDEVGELSGAAQAALLRVLETGVVNRLGGRKEVQVDVRILAATNRDLKAMVAEGRFRADLLHRLNAVTLEVPPLRVRREEIPTLAAGFLDDDRLPEDKPSRIDEQAMACLLAYDWPGNVRELRNVIERAAVVAEGPEIRMLDLPSELHDVAAPREPADGATPADPGMAPRTVAEAVPEAELADRSFRDRMRDYELGLIHEALRATDGHKANAAKLLNMPLRTFMARLQK